MTIIAIRPRHELEYVEKARSVFQDKLPGQDFDAHVWDVKPLRKRAHKRSNPNLYWTTYGSQTKPLPAGFIEPIKAACVLDLQSPTNLTFRADSARFLWEHLKQQHDPAAFHWAQLKTDDMLGMEREMLCHLKKSSTYKMCMAWNRIIELLVTARILRPMNVPWATPRPEDTDRHTIRGQQERAEKLPSHRAMETVADLFIGLATEPPDRLMACACVIAACTGLRVGELLTLPEDCLVERDGTLFVKVWIEKNKSRELVTQKVPLRARDLVLEAITEARAITAQARARAKVLEDNPGYAPLPGYQPLDRLTSREAAEVMGTTRTKPSEVTKQIGRPCRRDPKSGEKHFLASDISGYLSGRQGNLWAIKLTGAEQPLSESLFVVPVNFFHAGNRPQIPLLVELGTEQQLNQFLGGTWSRCTESQPGAVMRTGEWFRKSKKSIFDRLDLREDDGSVIEITSHQFRHWITTLTRAGGASSPIVKRWQNRSHTGDISAYEHLTMEQRVATLRTSIESGRVTGDIADVYFTLVEDVRDAFLENQLQHVHVMALGLCVHDYGASPCPMFLACLKGDCGPCGDYLHDRSDPVQVTHLDLLETRTETVLQEELRLAAERDEQISNHWIEEQRQVLSNIRRAKSAPGDGVVRPFAGNPSKFTPIREA